MDPTTALADVRVSAEQLLSVNPPYTGSEVAALIEAVQALDEWMSKGGFLPAQWTRANGRPRLSEPGTTLEGVAHGKRSAYNQGCHCLACRAANRLGRNLNDNEMREYA